MADKNCVHGGAFEVCSLLTRMPFNIRASLQQIRVLSTPSCTAHL